jgi:hypothetical protein
MSFNASFDADTGNYNISLRLVGKFTALLFDTPLSYAVNAPKMYNTQITVTEPNGNKSFFNTYKGRQKLNEVYKIYKRKGLIADNFPQLSIEDFVLQVENYKAALKEDLKKQEDFTKLNDLQDFEEYMGYPYWQSKQEFESAFINWWGNKTNVVESSKKKMKNMVEDIVDKKFPKEVVDKLKKYGDIRKNGVPDIEVISEENPLLVRKVKSLVDIVEKNQATGEQKGVILNFLINNIGTIDIPAEYKQEMLKKLR